MREASVALASSNLRRRTLTAFVLGPLVIAAVLWLPTPAFGLFFALVVLVGAWEWCGLAGISSRIQRFAYLGLMALALGLLWSWPVLQTPLLTLSALWWLSQSISLLRVRQIDLVVDPQPHVLILGLFVLAAPWAAMISLHGLAKIGPGLVLSLLILIWTADSLAYFVGRRWGRAKLAPAVSPGKTWIGVYGAILGAALFGLLLAWSLSLPPGKTALAILVCVLSALVSVVGDLYESLLKRRRALKDSSQLLPGHGGFLDRIDSLTAAAPFYALGMTWALT